MKANKVTLSIKLECLSTDTIKGLLLEVIEEIDREKVKGKFSHDDGDQAEWEVEIKSVEF